MTPRMQRRMLPLAALAAAAIGLSGCGTASSTTSQELTDDDVTLTLAWWGADARTQQTNEAIALFEEAYPNVSVEAQNSDWTGYWDRLATTTAAGDMPDVLQMDQLYLASYADRGTLLDLGAYPDILDTDYMEKSVLDSGIVNDAQFAVPTSGAPNAVIVNTALFEEYGVPLPDFSSWTWDEYVATAEALTEASGGVVNGATPFGSDSNTLNLWARQQGEQLFDDEGDIAVSADTVASYWQLELDMIASGAAPSAQHLSEVTGVALDQSDIVTGRTAMQFIAAGQFTSLQSTAPEATFTLADWPTGSDTEADFQYIKPTMYWAGASTSEHPAEAAALIDFLTTDEEVGALFGTDRGISANPTIQKVIEPDLTPAGRIAFDYITNALETAGPSAPITPNGASDIDTIIGRYNQQVQFGTATPEEAAEALIAEVQSSIDATG